MIRHIPVWWHWKELLRGYKTDQMTFAAACTAVVFLLAGCGSLTGIPGHGGGKRFAVEQELVAAATRATLKEIDLASINGRKVNIFINAIGDKGAGNLAGGRFSLVSQLRGDYIQTAPVSQSSTYPLTTTTTTSTTSTRSSSGLGTASDSFSSGTTVTDAVLGSPTKTESRQEGSGGQALFGAEYNGLGAYRTSEEITSDDLQYLSGLIQTYLFLKGVNIVPPSEAEVDVYVTVDVFGTVYTRVDWILANNEILRAKTALEFLAVDHLTGDLLMQPQSASVEAEYNEQYVLWIGPVSKKKILKTSEPLLSDYTNLDKKHEKSKTLMEMDGELDYPFRNAVEKWSE